MIGQLIVCAGSAILAATAASDGAGPAAGQSLILRRPGPENAAAPAVARPTSVRVPLVLAQRSPFIELPWPADEMEADWPLEAGRQALSGPTRYPWYDPERDVVRRVDVAPLNQTPSPDNRLSSWEWEPTSRRSSSWPLLSWIGRLMLDLLAALVWIAIAMVITVLLWLLIRTLLRREAQAGQSAATRLVRSSSDVDRIENLPFPLRRAPVDLLAEARRCYEAGNYREAIVYLFSHMLVQLDRQGLVQLAKGKTNRQYLRELRPRPQLGSMLEAAMVTFEDVFFGNHPLDRQRFERHWSQLEQFHQLVEQEGSS